jgi:hypothetical protein
MSEYHCFITCAFGQTSTYLATNLTNIIFARLFTLWTIVDKVLWEVQGGTYSVGVDEDECETAGC